MLLLSAIMARCFVITFTVLDSTCETKKKSCNFKDPVELTCPYK